MGSRFQFVDDHRNTYEVKRLCQVLGVNRSSYYKWLAGAEARATRQREDRILAEEIREVHGESGGAYGSPRVTAELREKGRRVNEKRVARILRTFSITGIRLRRRMRTTVPGPTAPQVPDLFGRDFTATEPGRKYMGDITYLPLAGGEFLYLATVLDCFSRKVVGWSIADTCFPMLLSSRVGDGRCDLVAPEVTDQRPDDIHPPSGEGYDSLDVTLPLGAFPVVERPGVGIELDADERGGIEDPLEATMVGTWPVQVATDLPRITWCGSDPGGGGQPIRGRKSLQVSARDGEKLGTEQGADARHTRSLRRVCARETGPR